MVWRPPCTESAGLSRMPSRRTMAGKAVALAGVLGGGELGLGDGRACWVTGPFFYE